MKKLLFLSLALFVALSLIIINTKDAKAVDSNDAVDYGLKLMQDGTIKKSTDDTTVTPAGITYDSQNSVWKMNNFYFETTALYGILLTGNTTIEINGTNTVTVNYPTNDNYRKGAIYNQSNGYTLIIKSIDGTNNHVINFKNVSTNTDNSKGIYMANDATIKFESGTINCEGEDAGLNSGSMEVVNAIFNSNSSTGRGVDCVVKDGLTITGSGMIKAKTLQQDPGAISAYANTANYFSDNFIVKGTIDGSTTGLIDVEFKNAGWGRYETKIGSDYAKYVEMSGIIPAPIPTPEIGDMTYDSTKQVGDAAGTFVDSVKKGNASKIMHVVNIAANSTTTKIYKKGSTTWETSALGTSLYTLDSSSTADPKYSKLTFNKDYINTLDAGTHDYKVVLNDSATNKEVTFYIELTVTESQKPSPSKKDESCEKVIGPTWHWNNDKGICEEYATVGTSTR